MNNTTSLSPVPSPTPLTILLHDRIPGVSDFFPFQDLAVLSRGDNDAFSFKKIFEEGIDGDQYIVLFSSGCRLPGGEHDCTRACNDTSLFFGSLETFYNCATLASVAYWTREERSYYVGPGAEANVSAIMGAEDVADFEARPVLESFISCAKDACTNDGLSVPCDRAVDGLSINGTSEAAIFDVMEGFCPEIVAEVNPDIFGPGVLISYVLQVCFSGALYLSLKAFTLYVRYSERRKTPPKLNRIQSMIWPDASAMSRTSIAIATTLVEFQEAQCWFVFAVQIASILAIVVNSQEGTFWGEIIVNAAVAFHVSQNGILPMFLIQICLHNEGIRNWHTFLGFLAEYILAIVATTQKIYFEDAFALFKGQNPIASCGGNPSPRTYCVATQDVSGFRLGFFPHPLLYKMVFLVLDTIAITVLLVDQLTWTLRRHHRTRHIRFGSYQAGRGPIGRLKPYWLVFKRWFWHGLEITYLVINVLYMISLIKVVKAESFQANRWSYGQIISVTIWGPVIVKLFDLILSGPPKNGMRLSQGPPRLRIDNIINRRPGISLDDLDEADDMLQARGPVRADLESVLDINAMNEDVKDDETQEGQMSFPRETRHDESQTTQRL